MAARRARRRSWRARLQDHRRATVVGTKSFGKGSVQTIIPLAEKRCPSSDDGALLHAAGTSIQARGILPDIRVEQPVPEELLGQDVERGESELRGQHRRRRGRRKRLGFVRLCPAGQGRRPPAQTMRLI